MVAIVVVDFDIVWKRSNRRRHQMYNRCSAKTSTLQ